MSTSIKEIEASQTWSLRHEVMWPDMAYDYVKLPEDELARHFGLYRDEDLTSIVSIFTNEKEAQFRKFATKVSAQGNGYGTQLLSHVFERLEKEGIKRIWCNARLDKTSFYRGFGMKETAHTFVKSGQPYVVMEKIISN